MLDSTDHSRALLLPLRLGTYQNLALANFSGLASISKLYSLSYPRHRIGEEDPPRQFKLVLRYFCLQCCHRFRKRC